MNPIRQRSKWLDWQPRTPNNGEIGQTRTCKTVKNDFGNSFAGFAGSTFGEISIIQGETVPNSYLVGEAFLRRVASVEPVILPHCPKCSSYYLVPTSGSFECLTCGLSDIDATDARRVQ